MLVIPLEETKLVVRDWVEALRPHMGELVCWDGSGMAKEDRPIIMWLLFKLFDRDVHDSGLQDAYERLGKKIIPEYVNKYNKKIKFNYYCHLFATWGAGKDYYYWDETTQRIKQTPYDVRMWSDMSGLYISGKEND